MVGVFRHAPEYGMSPLDMKERGGPVIACNLARKENLMVETTDPLVLDLVEWIARQPRLYSEVIETWRTSCPRLTIWEDAVDRGYVTREAVAGLGIRVVVTADGARFLRAQGRVG
jgi:hypothetical protein